MPANELNRCFETHHAIAGAILKDRGLIPLLSTLPRQKFWSAASIHELLINAVAGELEPQHYCWSARYGIREYKALSQSGHDNLIACQRICACCGQYFRYDDWKSHHLLELPSNVQSIQYRTFNGALCRNCISTAFTRTANIDVVINELLVPNGYGVLVFGGLTALDVWQGSYSGIVAELDVDPTEDCVAELDVERAREAELEAERVREAELEAEREAEEAELEAERELLDESGEVHGRNGYHNSRRDMWPKMADDIVKAGGIPMGIELETRATHYVDIDDLCLGSGWLAESDGSLDEESGVEFITPPLNMGECAKAGSELHNFILKLRKNHFIGWDAGTDYGMHINVDRESFNNHLHQACFALTINNAQALSEVVAGRRETHWATYNMKATDEAIERARFAGSDHYSAVAIRSRVLEVRIFRSTLKWSSVQKNIQYVQAAFEFAKKQDLKAAISQTRFRAYIMRHAKAYPQLVEFLKEKGRTDAAFIGANDGSELHTA